MVTAGGLGLLGLAGLRLIAPRAFRQVQDAIGGSSLALAGGVAALATAASLWFSEAAHFPPCKLCWYQRIAMYPLAVLLPLAAWRRDDRFRIYGVVLAGIGLAVSTWHSFIETFPERDLGGCDPTNPCTVRWVEAFGLWTIPRMAWVCFAMVLVLLLLGRARTEADR